MLLAFIAGCEIAFWLLLAVGLATRYLLRRPRWGMAILAGVPLVDVVLLVAGFVDLQRGAEPAFRHSLAAVFIGCSVAFGHQTLTWADRWAAHVLAGAPRPAKRPGGGAARAARERQGWYRHLLAWGIGSGLMLLGALLSGGIERSGALLQPAVIWTVVLIIDGFVSFGHSVGRRSWQQPVP